MDFDQITYKKLLNALISKYEETQTFADHIIKSKLSDTTSSSSILIIRHDVDRLPENSLNFALLEHSLGIKGTYYFRIVRDSYNMEIMNKIGKLGHELGYHYEDVDLVSRECRIENAVLHKYNKKRFQEVLIDKAYSSFCKNLARVRENFEIKTICMHGSPKSKYDNKIIWEKYNYRDLGIIGEPYYDIDFNEFAYFTDTGRRWNGHRYSIRDKVNSKYNFDFKSTYQIIENIDKLPKKIMFTIHPERWNNNVALWCRELLLQNLKNIGKRILLLRNRQ